MVKVGFSTPRRFNPISWIVRKFTGSRCSHAWFLYEDTDWDMEMVVEAHELGFRLIPYAQFLKHNIVIKLIEPKFPISAGLKMVAREYLGTAYDYAGLLGMAVVTVGRFLRYKWKNPFRSTRLTFCSEAVVRAMLWSPGYSQLELDPNDVEPEDLLEYFTKESADVLRMQAHNLTPGG